jgi:hypothetical protein
MDPSQRQLVEQAITGTFIWDFIKGDNIIDNYETIWQLYRSKSAVDALSRNSFNKPIILLLAAILECIFDDFTTRIQNRATDPLPNVTDNQITDYKNKHRDKFASLIEGARKQQMMFANQTYYDEMLFLKDARNRIHIQNRKLKPPIRERELYTDKNLRRIERVFEFTIQQMVTKYFRWGSPKVDYRDIPYPWKYQF